MAKDPLRAKWRAELALSFDGLSDEDWVRVREELRASIEWMCREYSVGYLRYRFVDANGEHLMEEQRNAKS